MFDDGRGHVLFDDGQSINDIPSSRNRAKADRTLTEIIVRSEEKFVRWRNTASMDPRYARSSSWIVKVRQRHADVEFKRQILRVRTFLQAISLARNGLFGLLFVLQRRKVRAELRPVCAVGASQQPCLGVGIANRVCASPSSRVSSGEDR